MHGWMDKGINDWIDGWVEEWINKWIDGWMYKGMARWMDGWVEEWMNEWMDGWMDEWMDGWMDGWMNGWMEEWINGWMNKWMNGWVELVSTYLKPVYQLCHYIFFVLSLHLFVWSPFRRHHQILRMNRVCRKSIRWKKVIRRECPRNIKRWLLNAYNDLLNYLHRLPSQISKVTWTIKTNCQMLNRSKTTERKWTYLWIFGIIVKQSLLIHVVYCMRSEISPFYNAFWFLYLCENRFDFFLLVKTVLIFHLLLKTV